jgi:type I restriction enzyme, S subunit
MSFRRYPAYKPSGVEWLGEVPEHWQVKRVRRIFEIKKRIAGELGFDILSITQQGIKVRDPESNDGQVSMDYSKYQVVEPGDFAMNHMDLLTGYVDISGRLGVTSPDYRVFSIAEPNGSHPGYLLNIFQMGYKQKILYAYGQGSSQLGRWRLPTEEFQDWAIPFPSLEEQASIGIFLDHETAKIDALIAEQQRLIELLQEKRQAVISHAVTKGLNPDAPMKDSGVEWLGEVPEHWEVVRFKRFCELQRGHDLTNEEREDGPHPVVTSAGINGYHSQYIAKAPGVVTGRYGSTGTVFFIEQDYWPHNTSLYIKDFHENSPRFSWYLLQAIDLISLSVKSAVPGIDRNDVHELFVASPDLSDQNEVATYLDNYCHQQTRLVQQAERSTELLAERRTALISAAVTGKIDVRGLVPEDGSA